MRECTAPKPLAVAPGRRNETSDVLCAAALSGKFSALSRAAEVRVALFATWPQHAALSFVLVEA